MARIKVCPNPDCGGENPGDELFCVACGISLSDVISSERQVRPDRATESLVAQGKNPVGTVRETIRVGLVELVFEWGPVTIRGRLKIGRDIDFSQVAESLARYDTVSRQHAEVFMEAGEPFVRHLGTTNPTYVNGSPLEPNETARLADGDTIGFSRAVIATVRFGSGR